MLSSATSARWTAWEMASRYPGGLPRARVISTNAMTVPSDSECLILCKSSYIIHQDRGRCVIGRRSDTKQKMVQAARQLIRERGYNATAFSDVLELSGAPRGSVYFHFPGGKTQLAMEAAEAHAHEQVTLIDRAADQADSA